MDIVSKQTNLEQEKMKLKFTSVFKFMFKL